MNIIIVFQCVNITKIDYRNYICKMDETQYTMNELRRPSIGTSNAEREYNKVLQQNTNNNKKTSHKSKIIKFSFININKKMIMSPLFYSNKIFITETKLDRSRVQSSFEIDRSGEEVITPRRNSKEMYGYRPRSISIWWIDYAIKIFLQLFLQFPMV